MMMVMLLNVRRFLFRVLSPNIEDEPGKDNPSGDLAVDSVKADL